MCTMCEIYLRSSGGSVTKGVREIFTIVLPGLPSCESKLTKEKIRQKTVSHGAVPSSYYMVSVPLPCFLWESGIMIYRTQYSRAQKQRKQRMIKDLRITISNKGRPCKLGSNFSSNGVPSFEAVCSSLEHILPETSQNLR
jgi:hypothetical protein